MSIVNVYSIYDEQAQAYMAPFTMKAHGLAVRAFIATLSDPQTTMYRYPNDFSLYYIATFDDETTKFVSHVPELVKRGHRQLQFDFMQQIDVPAEELKEAEDGAKV